MFALAYEENVRVVTISTKQRHRIPLPGTPEAEAILGRATPGGHSDVQHLREVHDVEKGSSGAAATPAESGRSSVDGVSGEDAGGKGVTQHDEVAGGRRMSGE
jgi:hypothetical protein